MAALTKAEFSASLPSLVRDAAARLASAETSAEVLDARLMATAAYDAAKSAARIATAKRAHDEIIVAVYKAQADTAAIARVLAALEIHPPSPSERPPARPGAPTLGDASAASPSASPSAIASEAP